MILETNATRQLYKPLYSTAARYATFEPRATLAFPKPFILCIKRTMVLRNDPSIRVAETNRVVLIVTALCCLDDLRQLRIVAM